MTEMAGRLLPFQTGSPSYNMAVDQTLLESVDENGRPTVRLYRWDRPTLSLGYFQSMRDRAQHRESQQLAWVRRGTGGGAIVHHHELTYSVALPVSDLRVGARDDLYRQLHQAVVDVLCDFGIRAVPYRLTTPAVIGNPEPWLCFQRRTPEDLILAGYKVLGSAQRRSRRAVLQHGSLLIESSPMAPQLPGINELASTTVSVAQLAEPLVARFAAAIGVNRWQIDALSDLERKRIGAVQESRFDHPAWLGRR